MKYRIDLTFNAFFLVFSLGGTKQTYNIILDAFITQEFHHLIQIKIATLVIIEIEIQFLYKIINKK